MVAGVERFYAGSCRFSSDGDVVWSARWPTGICDKVDVESVVTAYVNAASVCPQDVYVIISFAF